VKYVFHHPFVENDSLSLIFAMLDRLKTFRDRAVWKDCSSGNSIARVPRGVGKIQGLSTLKKTNDNISLNILSGSFSGVDEQCWDQKGFSNSKGEISWHQGESNPSAFVLPKISIGIYHGILRGFRSLFHFAQLAPVDENGYNPNYCEAKLYPESGVMDRMEFFHNSQGTYLIFSGSGLPQSGHARPLQNAPEVIDSLNLSLDVDVLFQVVDALPS
jgi:hypothetical protein